MLLGLRGVFTAAQCRGQIEPDAAGRAQRKVVGEFKSRLARIIEKNDTLPELEKLERSDFVVDVAGRCGRPTPIKEVWLCCTM